LKSVRPEITEDQYKQFLEEMFHEYFEHGDTIEVIVSCASVTSHGHFMTCSLTFQLK